VAQVVPVREGRLLSRLQDACGQGRADALDGLEFSQVGAVDFEAGVRGGDGQRQACGENEAGEGGGEALGSGGTDRHGGAPGSGGRGCGIAAHGSDSSDPGPGAEASCG
jgi:hypothetical protein